MLGEDAELLEAIIYNDDNRTYDEIEELRDLIRDARITTKIRHEFLDYFVDSGELVATIEAQPPR